MPIDATYLNFGTDVQRFNTFLPQQAAIIYTATLSNSSPTTLTIPSTYQKWIMYIRKQQAASNLYVAVNGTASLPAGSSFALSASDLNPDGYTVYAGDVVSFLPASANVSVAISLYASL